MHSCFRTKSYQNFSITTSTILAENMVKIFGKNMARRQSASRRRLMTMVLFLTLRKDLGSLTSASAAHRIFKKTGEQCPFRPAAVAIYGHLWKIQAMILRSHNSRVDLQGHPTTFLFFATCKSGRMSASDALRHVRETWPWAVSCFSLKVEGWRQAAPSVSLCAMVLIPQAHHSTEVGG